MIRSLAMIAIVVVAAIALSGRGLGAGAHDVRAGVAHLVSGQTGEEQDRQDGDSEASERDGGSEP